MMDKLISKTKVLIPGLGWRLKQSLIFSFFGGLLYTFIIWTEDTRLSQLAYVVPVLAISTLVLLPWFFGFSVYYEGRRKKWLADQQ